MSTNKGRDYFYDRPACDGSRRRKKDRARSCESCGRECYADPDEFALCDRCADRRGGKNSNKWSDNGLLGLRHELHEVDDGRPHCVRFEKYPTQTYAQMMSRRSAQ